MEGGFSKRLKMKKDKKPDTVEEGNGVHSSESYPYDVRKPVHVRYGEHIKMNESNAIDSDKVIDCRRRGKTQDITRKPFKLEEPEMVD